MNNHNKSDIWDTYLNSYIIDDDIVWAGPNAGTLPFETPIHVITACNPLSKKLSDKENQQRNQLLLDQLRTLNLKIKPVIGCSPGKNWQEPSFAVFGLSRREACKIANEFNQRGIFEIVGNELKVIATQNYETKKYKLRAT